MYRITNSRILLANSEALKCCLVDCLFERTVL
jgi:hypothetical protein